MSRQASQPLALELALVGLVQQHPLHGYEIYQRLKKHPTIGMVWKPKQSHVYALLKKLEQAGFLETTIETQDAYPPRKVLHITRAGAAAFANWLGEPVYDWEDVQREFLIKLFFAQRTSDAAALHLVERQRTESRAWLDELHQRMRSLTAYQSSEWLVIQFRIRQVEGFLDWLDRCMFHFTDPLFVVHTIAVLHDSPRHVLAQRFIDYICSPAGQAILEQYGFLPSGEAVSLDYVPPDQATYVSAQSDMSLTIFAAATLKDAFQALAHAFSNANSGITINLTFAGSSYLADQLVQGASADLFASANRLLMEPVMRTGRIAADSDRIFARNRLLVVTQHNSLADLTTLRDLAKPGLKIALGSGSTAIGHYSLNVLDRAAAIGNLGVDEHAAVLQNVAFYEQDVRAVLSRVLYGEADVGIVYTSDCRDTGEQPIVPVVYSLDELWLNSG